MATGKQEPHRLLKADHRMVEELFAAVDKAHEGVSKTAPRC